MLRADAIASTPNFAHILDETDDPLAALYNTTLRVVDKDIRRIMEIADTVYAKSGSRHGEGRDGAQDGKEPGFEVMANVVWAEIGRALMDELGSVIFAAGKPDEFRKVCVHVQPPRIRRRKLNGARFAAPRDDASFHSRAGVPCAVGALSAGDAGAYRVHLF